MRSASALSTADDSETAFREVLGGLSAGPTADLAVVFATAHHSERLSELAEAIRARRVAHHVLGCTGESIVADDREIEDGPAVVVWTVAIPRSNCTELRIEPEGGGFDELVAALGQGPHEGRILLTLADPFTFPMDEFLSALNRGAPGLRVAGGIASAAERPGQNRLILGPEVYGDGAVGVLLEGATRIRTIVSQGCRPIGRPMIVTRGTDNLIHELGRRPAVAMFQEVYDALPAGDQALVREGLHLGRVINEYQESFDRGDFLVRNVIGADRSGAIAITDRVRVGQTVQFHVRDAQTADEDLRLLLDASEARAGAALLFNCNGRGSRLFSEPNHDARVVRETQGAIPVAGFFAMGELGPIGGQNFIHGFTASVVLFDREA